MVVDANVVVAALIRPGGWTAHELARTDVDWIAPALLMDELDEHAADYAEKAECSIEEWRQRVRSLVQRMRVVPAGSERVRSALVRKAEQADPDDAIYVETLVAEQADLLWTRDAALLDALPGIAVSVLPRPSPSPV